MIRGGVVTAIFLMWGIAHGGMQLGLDLSSDLKPTITTSSAIDPSLERQTTDYYQLFISPYLGIRASELLEISPTIRYSFSHSYQKFDDSIASNSFKLSSTQQGLGLSVEILFHVLRTEHFEIALGPAVSHMWWAKPVEEDSRRTSNSPNSFSKYYNGRSNLYMPIKFDIKLSKHVGLRMGSNVANFSYQTYFIEYENNPSSTSEHRFNFSIISSWSPSLGVFFSL